MVNLIVMANFFYRDSVVRLSVTLLDINDNPVVGVPVEDIFFYLRYPNNIIHANDPNIALKSHNAVYEPSITVNQLSDGNFYVDYEFAQAGNYKYKFQVYSMGTTQII